MILELRRYLAQVFIGWAITASPNKTEADRQLTVGLTATLLTSAMADQISADGLSLR